MILLHAFFKKVLMFFKKLRKYRAGSLKPKKIENVRYLKFKRKLPCGSEFKLIRCYLFDFLRSLKELIPYK